MNNVKNTNKTNLVYSLVTIQILKTRFQMKLYKIRSIIIINVLINVNIKWPVYTRAPFARVKAQASWL